jgi:hypothetical protein
MGSEITPRFVDAVRRFGYEALADTFQAYVGTRIDSIYVVRMILTDAVRRRPDPVRLAQEFIVEERPRIYGLLALASDGDRQAFDYCCETLDIELSGGYRYLCSLGQWAPPLPRPADSNLLLGDASSETPPAVFSWSPAVAVKKVT